MRIPPPPFAKRLTSPPVINIKSGASFFRRHPSSRPPPSQHPHQQQPKNDNPPLFKGVSFQIPSHLPQSSQQNESSWVVIGPSRSGKTSFLQMLRGELHCSPVSARTWPWLTQHNLTPQTAIKYVGFNGKGISEVTTSAYLSARYESLREDTDFSLKEYLLGETQFNLGHIPGEHIIDRLLFDKVVKDLRLTELLDIPVAFLSNGQSRRAAIAKALMAEPEVLLLDEPFVGLDPGASRGLGEMLKALAERASPRVVISSRPQDPLPDWIQRVVYLEGAGEVAVTGELEADAVQDGLVKDTGGRKQVEIIRDADEGALGDPLVEIKGCMVRYGNKIALGNWEGGLHWTVRRGQRWGVFGPNGSGKTTIVALLCSDHPQTYSLPIKLFGRNRMPDPGSDERPLTFWDIQSRVGHSSPEIHRHMPRSLNVRQVLESAWADTFKGVPKLDQEAKDKVEATLRWFEKELNPRYSKDRDSPSGDIAWAQDYLFGGLSFSAQRVLLFLRAIIKHPDIVVLDEAFSGMDEYVRDKCMLFLACGEEKAYTADRTVAKHPVPENIKVKGLGEDQALICISHVKEEVPDCVKEWMCLPEPNMGLPARFGRLERPLKTDEKTWMHDIWALK
ncbi:putative ABC transporter [Triangularia verruculosa]|uniref:ABC transporter n=1 Tax=Triangularia verruculosa TaxID=2587418 RepID=A0AAN7AXP9_9PEZI|nr:putative ABC transporter [Triangularia verruculosa]